MTKSAVARHVKNSADIIIGTSEMAGLIRAYEWDRTSLGAISGWPQSLITSVNLILQSPVPMVMLWDRSGIMIYNDAYAVFAGGRHPALLGSSVADGWPEVADFNANVMKHAMQGKALSYKDQQLTLNRNNEPEEVWMDLNYSPIIDEKGKPGGVLSIVVETTQQVLSLRRAEELNAQLEAVFDSLPDGLYIARDAKITRINQRGAEALGFRRPEDVPRDLKELYRLLTVNQLRGGKELHYQDSTLGHALKGRSIQHVGVQVTNPITGKKQIIRTAGAPIRDKNGMVIGAVAINNDLTEQYAMQEKIQKEVLQRKLLAQKAKLLKQQNIELTKLNATKNEFIALTSHQLRTPATGVKQYVAMLLQGYAGPITPEQEQFLERAYESNERQLHIIEDILRVAKVDMGKTLIDKKPQDMLSLVQNVLGEQADRFTEHQQKVVTDFPSQPVLADIDAAQLHMAIGNIIDNAIKYTADGKQITVRLKQLKKDVELQITDQGVGIAKADQDKLFQKFSRIPNPRSILVGGTGLGLYWTKRIIQLHGGTIDVSSQPGKGTTFTIQLPLA